MWKYNVRNIFRNNIQIKKVFGFILLLIQFTQVDAQWNWVNPYPQGNTLRSIQFVNSSIGYIAGDGGTVLKTTDGGQNWTRLNTGTLENLNAIFFTDPDTGYAVGQQIAGDGFIIKTKDGGDTWDMLSGTFGWSNPLYAVYFTSTDTGYIAGYNYLYKTRNGGTTWQQLNPPGSDYHCIVFTSAQTGYIASGWELSKTINGGLTWNQLLVGRGTLSISFPTANTGYVTGIADTLFKTTDAGSTWIILHTGNSSWIHSLCFLDTLNGFAIGDSGTILKTSNGGNSWTLVSSGLSTRWMSVSFADNLHGSAVGDYGSTAITADQGNHWTSYWGAVTLDTLSDIVFPSKNVGYIAGTMGTILKTTLSGNSWTKLTSGSSHDLYSLSFVNNDYGFAAGESGTILKTIDGGITWMDKSPGINETIYNVFFIDVNIGYFTGSNDDIYKTMDGGENWIFLSNPGFSCNGIYFTHPDTGYILGYNGKAKKTTDGGNSWELMNTGTNNELYDILFINSKTGFINGYKVILKTKDGGLTWSNKYTGYRPINSISFCDSLNGYALTGGFGSFILITSDGGDTWSTENDVGMTNYYLTSLTFITLDTGYVIGRNGVILKTTTGGMVTGTRDYVYPNDTRISCYPNPANDRVYIPVNEHLNSSVKIFNIMGKIVFSESFYNIINPLTIDVSSLLSGVYQLVMISDKKISSFKIIVIH